MSPVQQESLILLEWPQVCRQVAAFTQTVMGAEQLLSAGLPLGSSQAQSEEHLQHTADSIQAQLKFDKLEDIRPCLLAAQEDAILHSMQLNEIAATLQVGSRLRAELRELQAGGTCHSLSKLATGLQDTATNLYGTIRQAVQDSDGSILDRASEALGRLRRERADNLAQLRLQAEEWGRTLHSKGASERPQVVFRRGRLCLPVKSNRQGEVPKGSMRLGQSSTGATTYIEPTPIVPLNNKEAQLSSAVENEEARVLRRLTKAVAKHKPTVDQVLEALTALDIANARGRHAGWISGVRPVFLSRSAAQMSGCMAIHAARHPLLLQRGLAPLPLIPGFDEASDPFRAEVGGHQADKNEHQHPDQQQQPSTWRPHPVDLLVPPDTTVAAVTGPNTGGKTASLKTMGLMALMAKAGMYLPIVPSPSSQQNTSADSNGATLEHAPAGPRLQWFDSVLADVGDSQDLQQSLSTFSGHVRRLSRILAAAGSSSLVLLDEVGSGTDPNEGAALATAVLTALAGRARFTFATTHHASLSSLAAQDPRFVNASVEFNVDTLRPTYRLLWGTAGASHALSVAEGLKFDPVVIADARRIATSDGLAMQAGGGGQQHAEAMKGSIADELDSTKARAKAAAEQSDKARRTLERLSGDSANLQAELSALQGNRAEKKARSAVQRADKRLGAIVRDCQAGTITPEEARKHIDAVRAEASNASQAAASLRRLQGQGSQQQADSARSGWLPNKGDRVQVPSMGGATGEVVDVRPGDSLSVRVGQLTVRVRPGEVLPLQQQHQQQGRSGKQTRSSSRPASGAPGLDASEGNAPAGKPVAVQTAGNTVDVRGMRADKASQAVDDAIAGLSPGLALFVIHGMGTGKLKAAITEMLASHPFVERLEAEQGTEGATNSGCTIVFPKQ